MNNTIRPFILKHKWDMISAIVVILLMYLYFRSKSVNENMNSIFHSMFDSVLDDIDVIKKIEREAISGVLKPNAPSTNSTNSTNSTANIKNTANANNTSTKAPSSNITITSISEDNAVNNAMMNDETILPNDLDIGQGSSLFRAVRVNGTKSIVGEVKLSTQIGQKGGEGTVYRCNVDNKVCKVYHKNKITNLRLAKLVEMQIKKLQIRGVCWPQELLYNKNGQFCGYLMSSANGDKLQTSVMHPKVIGDKFPQWKRKQLVLLCLSIVNIIDKLHKNDIIVGDINANNILLTTYNDVYFIDCDSFQIGKYPCPVGTPYFTPREIQGKKYSEFLRTKEHDMFAITTLVFMILFLGKPPYSVRGGGQSC